MFLIAEGTLPVCVVAHMDTVFPHPPHTFYYDKEQTTLWSPDGLGADDRSGVYAIISLIERGYRPSVVFTDLEERGAIGSSCLIERYPECPFKNCKAIIQLDRRGQNDSVFYDCDNAEFEEKINSYGFSTARGSFSDISVIAPQWNIAAVNLSCGYLNEHDYIETLNTAWLDETIEKVANMFRDCTEWNKYIYIPRSYIPVVGGNWWDQTCCVCCGKELKNGEGHYCNASPTKENDFKVCDNCYDDYFFKSWYGNAKEEGPQED
jgi:hypothetical protein